MFKLAVKIDIEAFEKALETEIKTDVPSIVAAKDAVVAAVKAIKIPKKIGDFQALKDSIIAIKTAVFGVVEIVETVSAQVEKEGKMTSEEKKDLAVTLLDALIKFPLYFEMVDEIIFSFLITFVVDELNKRVGANWLGSQG